jgi:hypothetical protein
LVGNTNHREIWLFAFGNEILKLFPWWKSIQKIKKERSFHPRGQNSWPAVLSPHRSGILIHLKLISLVKIWQSGKMNIVGKWVFFHQWLRKTVMKVKHNYFYPTRLHWTLITVVPPWLVRHVPH